MIGIRGLVSAVVAIGLILSAGAAAAQDPGEAEIEALITATESDAGTMTLARRQVASGDLTGAATTLERSLLLRPGPESDHVRLYYASVLCRLGDPRRGAYQIANVHDTDAPEWAEARQACGGEAMSTPAPRGDGVSGLFSIGTTYDSDAYGATTIQFEAAGLPAVSEDGVSLVAAGMIDARFSSRESGHGYAGASLRGTYFLSGPEIDYLIGTVRAGYAVHLGGGTRELQFGGLARQSYLKGDSFLTELGAQVAYTFPSEGRGRWTVQAEAVDQDYGAASRDGGRFDLALIYRGTPSRDRAWMAGAAFEVKGAGEDYLGYRGLRMFAATEAVVSRDGVYVGASGVVRFTDFNDTLSGFDRHETRTHLRAVVGMPLARDGWFAEAAITYSGRWNNEASIFRDFNSTGAELRLVYRFGE